MKLVAFFRDSQGEADWLLPFIRYSAAKGVKWDVYFYFEKNKTDVIKKYKIHNENINIYCGEFIYLLYSIDMFIDKIDIRATTLMKTKSIKKITNPIRKLLSSPISRFGIKSKPNILFRDYNLKDSILLNSLSNKQTKVVVFPHAVGIQRSGGNVTVRDIRVVSCSLWLENTILSDYALAQYREQFKAVGIPAFSYESRSKFNIDSKKVIILTRDCGPVYGFTFKDAFDEYRKLVNFLHRNNFTIYLKNHPRDKNAYKWSSLINSNDVIVSSSLDDLEDDFLCCFSLYSTAGIFLLKNKIPILEFTPYDKKYFKSIRPFHYINNRGNVSHDLLEYNIFTSCSVADVEKLYPHDYLEYLENLSTSQYQKLLDYFPIGANKNIYHYVSLLNNE